ncbi:MAG: site-specific DNA-methyltransferase [Armatimonadetes bacterium]|nr:site-specific DNA-methyltransferase [Armatimonadota bacterium]
MARKKTEVEHTKHDEKRFNIPTNEMRGFVKEAENTPYNVMYERDPSLDPQLVWTGKSNEDLNVPAVLIYIQEKIHPRALIEDLLKEDKQEQAELFADFNGLDKADFEKNVDFYSHEDDRMPHWSNRMILGDSLLVMNSLAEKEGLRGKAQMIYVDPPYGIKFGSNWQISTRRRDVKDGKVEDIAREPEVIRAFRDTWEKGIHSYLAYLRDRFMASRDLLNETGNIFVQISDENVHLVRSLLDEVFGAGNFVSQINFRSMTALGASGMANVYDYVLWYAKNIKMYKYRPLYVERKIGDEKEFGFVAEEDGKYQRIKLDDLNHTDIPLIRRLFRRSELRSSGYTPSCTYPFQYDGKTFTPTAGKSWRTHSVGMANLIAAHRILVLGQTPYYRQYFMDFPAMNMENSWTDTAAGYSEAKKYVVQTSERVILRCLLMTTDPGDLVIDPTCGSGTTAYVAEQWGRRWVTVDTSRVALALARTRLMASRYPFYLLADSSEGVKKESELMNQVPPIYVTRNDIRKGFVYQRIPHVTLKSIANNSEITEGMTREQIDAAIARHAEQELLYDKPYEDRSKIRVSGPFTVESLSPHRMLSTDDTRPTSERDGAQNADDQFVPLVIENLLSAGIQNTKKNERLKFEALHAHPGTWIHATGSFTDSNGTEKRVAVSIGSEHASVTPKQLQEAAKEAVQGISFDILVICGYAFDPHVGEESKKYGDLVVLPAKMNEDLRMGKALKKSANANLFMVFGEPDIDIRKTKDGQIEVEVKGVDVYDPNTGEIRSDTPDEIACWFIDTDYNEESFFVRHAYFLGADDPYKRLKQALRAEIDEEAWASLYSAVSRPFPESKSGKIAIKVINHYGDEILKVYDV